MSHRGPPANISETAHEFLSRTQICVLATTGPGNSPHAVPMWYRYRDGIITILGARDSQKCRNVERTGKAMVVVDRREAPYYAVMVRGDASIGPGLSREEERELVLRYLGEDKVDAYLAEYEKRRDNVASIIVRPTRVIEFCG